MAETETKTETDTDTLKGCIAFLVVLLSYPLLWAWHGFAFKVIWGWFVVPIGAPAVTVAQGVGIVALVMLVRGERRLKKNFNFTKALPEIITRSVSLPIYILLVAWVAHWFMQ